jgi:hypothetical protein
MVFLSMTISSNFLVLMNPKYIHYDKRLVDMMRSEATFLVVSDPSMNEL